MMTAHGADGSLAEQLAAVVRACARSGLCPATGGNFSARLDAHSALITASGLAKEDCAPADLLRLHLQGATARPGTGRQPSAEAGLHAALYALEPDVGAVLHVHTVAATVLSRLALDELVFEGYEMAKALAGITSHRARLMLPIVDNSQDMEAIATGVRTRHAHATLPFAFLVRGHGLYAWGADLDAAHRHLQAWEFLLACELARRQITA